jgi:hypothetical protein
MRLPCTASAPPSPPYSCRTTRRSCDFAVGFPPVSLLTELDAFFTEHDRRGDLDVGVDDVMVWIACDCGASMARRADALAPDD